MGLSPRAGALLGRYNFGPRFGKDRWRRYAPVVTAGFYCGMGLAGMVAVAFMFIAYCTRDLPF